MVWFVSHPSFIEKSNNGVMQWSFWDFLKRKGTIAVIPEIVGCKRLGGVKVVDDRGTESRKAHTREVHCLHSFILPTNMHWGATKRLALSWSMGMQYGAASLSPHPHRSASLAGRQLVVLTKV